MKASPRAPHGFTLIELLVVISIIGLMVAILLPSLSAAKDLTKTLKCLANEKSVGQCIINYATDYKEFLPRPNQSVGNVPSAWDPTSVAGGSNLAGAKQGSALWFNAIDVYLNLPTLAYTSLSPNSVPNRNYAFIKQDPIYGESGIATTATAQLYNRTLKMNTYFDGDIPTSTNFAKTSMINHANGQPVVVLLDGRAMDIRFTGTINASSQNLFDAGETEIAMRHGKNRSKSAGDFSGLGVTATGGTNVYFDDGSARTVVQPYTTSATTAAWYADTTANKANGLQTLNWHLN